MNMPSPEDLSSAPLWENYAVAQAVQASLGQIPRSALAFGVQVSGPNLGLRFQLRDATADDQECMNDILNDLSDLVGPMIAVSSQFEIVNSRQISPTDGIRWIYLS